MMAQAAAAAASPQDASDCIAATEPVWCGTVVYRSVVPAERLRAVAPDHRVFNLSTHVRRVLNAKPFLSTSDQTLR
jgi:hypothetical protein